MPAFIGLPGAREKTEIGRGLFERSEFRSPRRRAKREAGIPDNQRATFLGYFFAAGKKLQNDVILTTARRKNLLQSVAALSRKEQLLGRATMRKKSKTSGKRASIK